MIERTLRAALLLMLVECAGAQQWQPNDTLTALSLPVMAYDSARERMVLVGLVDGSLQTWEYEGRDWVRRYSATVPVVDGHLDMVFDTLRSVIVMHAATYAGTATTWEWNGVDWSAVAQGPNLLKHALAFDPVSQRTILFGGVPAGSARPTDATWAFDGTSWTQLQPAMSPPPTSEHGMATDVARGRLVTVVWELMGASTWEWDGTNWAMVGAGPWFQAFEITYDAFRRRCVLVPAVYDSTSPPLAMYAWDGTSWTQSVSTPGPTARTRTTFAYYPPAASLMLYGGFKVVGPGVRATGETWAFDGLAWRTAVPEPVETAAVEASLQYDPARQRVVGLMSGSFAAVQDLLEWDGRAWNHVAATPFSSRGKLILDPTRGRSIAVVPDTTELQTWELTGNAFTQLPVTGPSTRGEFALVTDAQRGQVLLFGGHVGGAVTDEFWDWDGSSWRRIGGSRPSPRAHSSMAYDPLRDVVVLFGGSDNGNVPLGDTWEWDGTRWQALAPVHSPPDRSRHAMVYDPVLQRIVLIGGSPAIGAYPDAWSWDGVDWTPLPDLPGADDGVGILGAAFDAAGGHTVAMTLVANSAVQTFELTTDQPALAQPEGSSCAFGGTLRSELVGYGRPVLGRRDFGLDLVESHPQASALVSFSLGTSSLPLGPCQVWIDLTQGIGDFPLRTNSRGFAHLSLPLPPLNWNVPAFYAQAFTLNSSLPALAISSRLRLQLGD